MIHPPEFWLIVTGACPIVGAVATLATTVFGLRKPSLIAALTGIAGGMIASGVLAAVLLNDSGSETPEIRIILWNWFSFFRPQSLSIDFGLEATSIKAAMISLMGLIALIALISGTVRNVTTLSEDVILTISGLYAAGTVFVFAPNLGQALLGWAAVSFLAAILIRQSRIGTNSNRSDATAGIHPAEAVAAGGIGFLERNLIQPMWRKLSVELPTWLVDQIEILEQSSLSFQLLVTALFATSMLLTWLIISV